VFRFNYALDKNYFSLSYAYFLKKQIFALKMLFFRMLEYNLLIFIAVLDVCLLRSLLCQLR
jgi:hypothetical protein